jgi:hypothetical protein
MNKRLFKIFLIVLAIGAFAGAASAFAASNTVPASNAGDGSAAISGYTVTAVRYTLDGTNPRNIGTVAFTLSSAASDVRVKLVAASSTFFTCANAGGNNWTCAITGVTALGADQLTVVAVQ